VPSRSVACDEKLSSIVLFCLLFITICGPVLQQVTTYNKHSEK